MKATDAFYSTGSASASRMGRGDRRAACDALDICRDIGQRGAGEDPEVGAALALAFAGVNLALTLRVWVLTEPVKPAPFSFLVKVPMVAIVVFVR